MWFRRADDQADALAAAANHAKEIKEATYQVVHLHISGIFGLLDLRAFLITREQGGSWQTLRGRKKQERWNFLSSFSPLLTSHFEGDGQACQDHEAEGGGGRWEAA